MVGVCMYEKERGCVLYCIDDGVWKANVYWGMYPYLKSFRYKSWEVSLQCLALSFPNIFFSFRSIFHRFWGFRSAPGQQLGADHAY